MGGDLLSCIHSNAIARTTFVGNGTAAPNDASMAAALWLGLVAGALVALPSAVSGACALAVQPAPRQCWLHASGLPLLVIAAAKCGMHACAHSASNHHPPPRRPCAGTEKHEEFCEAYADLCAAAGHSRAYTDCAKQVAAMPQSARLSASNLGVGERAVIPVGSGFCRGEYVPLAETDTPQRCMDQARAREDCADVREVSWNPSRKDSRGRAQCLCDAVDNCGERLSLNSLYLLLDGFVRYSSDGACAAFAPPPPPATAAAANGAAGPARGARS